MINRKHVVTGMFILLLSLAACGPASKTGSTDVSGGDIMEGGKPQTPVVTGSNLLKNTEDFYMLDKGKTCAVVIVTEITGAEANVGTLAEGFPKEGLGAAKLKCEALAFFNYNRLKSAADAEEALYLYYNIGQFTYVGGGSVAKRFEKRPGSFNGDITEEYLEALKASNTLFTYNIYLDWDHKDSAEVGDILLIAIDPQVSINPNSNGNAYEIEDPKIYRAVVSPFAADHPMPHLVKFVEGKLQFPAELQDTFALRRLYDDTNPELTCIKDGDSVEDVAAFLKAVEQDMARYEEEQKQQPKSTDVSSIR